MSFITWHVGMSVGQKQFDDDHQKLLGLVNDLFDAITEGRGKEALSPILSDLVKYTEEHFRREEQFLLHRGFPGLRDHHLAHAEFAQKVRAMREQWSVNRDTVLMYSVLTEMRSWLTEHIMKEDKEYAAFMSRGANRH